MSAPINVALAGDVLTHSPVDPRGTSAIGPKMKLRTMAKFMDVEFAIYSDPRVPLAKVDDAINMNVSLFEGLARRHGLLH